MPDTKKEEKKPEVNPNMKLWDSVCVTDPSTTKDFKGKGGFQGTAICAQSQRKKATGLWGPFGYKWGLEDESYEIVKLSEDVHDTILVYNGALYYPVGEEVAGFRVCAEIDMWRKNGRDNDPYKKVRTDALTKGLSELGFNADVFEGLFDDNKYVQEQKQREADENRGTKTPTPPVKPASPKTDAPPPPPKWTTIALKHPKTGPIVMVYMEFNKTTKKDMSTKLKAVWDGVDGDEARFIAMVEKSFTTPNPEPDSDSGREQEPPDPSEHQGQKVDVTSITDGDIDPELPF